MCGFYTDMPKLNEFIDFAVYSCKRNLLFKEFIFSNNETSTRYQILKYI